MTKKRNSVNGWKGGVGCPAIEPLSGTLNHDSDGKFYVMDVSPQLKSRVRGRKGFVSQGVIPLCAFHTAALHE